MPNKTKLEHEEELISAVLQHPCIYLKKDRNYRNKDAKQLLWTEIGDAIGRRAETCKSQWKALRQQYLAFAKKIDNLPEGTPRPYFRHEKLMEPLKPQQTTYSSSADLEENNSENDSVDNVSDIDIKFFGEGTSGETESNDAEESEFHTRTTRILTKIQRRKSATKLQLENQLISLVRARPELYDTECSQYKNKKLLSTLWEDVAETMDIAGDGGQTPGNKCESIWKSLRSQYSNYMLKLRKFQIGRGMMGETYFRHAEAMHFLADLVHPKKTIEFFTSSSSSPAEYNMEGEDVTSSPSPTVVSRRPNISRMPVTVNSQQVPVTWNPIAFQVPNEDSRAAESLKPGNSPLDDVDHFLCSLAPALRRIHAKNPRRCAELKLKFMQLLTEAEYDD